MFQSLFHNKKKKEAIRKEGQILAVQTGRAVGLEDVPDPVFAQKMLGDGAAIIPSDGKIYSPVNGTVISLISSKHAYGIKGDDGAEILIHVGLETVQSEGEGFTCCVEEGQAVEAGDLLAEVDLDLLKGNGYNMITPIVITNMEVIQNIHITTGDVTGRESVLITYKIRG